MLAAILQRCPTPVGVLFDRPEVVATAHGAIDAFITAGRVQTVAGDFCEAVPSDGDAYLWIVHAGTTKTAISILKNCRLAMASGGRVLIIEAVVSDDAPGPDVTKLDTAMLVFTGNRERTENEYRGLLGRAGLTFVKSIPTRTPYSIIEAAG